MLHKTARFKQIPLINFNLILRNTLTQLPRRAVLYVPGDSEKHTEKALKLSSVDCVVFDCEDGVAHNRKNDARHLIKHLFKNKISETKHFQRDWAVRVNSVDSGLLAADLKEIYCDSFSNPKTIFLPKVNKIEDIEKFSTLLKSSIGELKSEPINLIFYSESCESILNLRDICKKAIDLSMTDRYFVPAGIVFGSDDFLANLGATRDNLDSSNILYARQKIVLTAKAFGLQAIDMVYINFKDIEGLKSQCIEGAKMGYTGKQTIHPTQVKTVQDAFMPSVEKIEWARECLKAYKIHQKLGKGAFVFRDQMIDNPTMEQASNILKLSGNADDLDNLK